MEKVAVVELSSNNIKLVEVEVVKNKSFNIFNEINTPINLTKGFNEDFFIKPLIIKEVLSVLSVYKKIIDSDGITEVVAVATNFLKEAKNHNGFINEIASVTGLKFNIMETADELNNVYTAVINTFNRPKALIINVTEFNTEIMLYNRRNIINTLILPFGYVTLFNKFEAELDICKKVENFVAENLVDNWMFELEEEYDVIGAGSIFRNLGKLSRRAKKYPVEIEHNYEMNKEDFEKVYSVIKSLDSLKASKVRGVSVEDSKYLQVGLAMINALISKNNKDSFAISAVNKIEGILLNYALPITQEKPISDNLGYSLQVLSEYYDKNWPKTENIYNLSMILFKQLKVLHKLSRGYVRILRVASFLYSCDKRVNSLNNYLPGFDIILNSQIYGVNHNELILAAFTAKLRESDNFNLSEWIKYKDLINEGDLEAVKKLAVILKLAESLNITGFNSISDITCDILGDSVILKTVADKDVYLEIKQALLSSGEFKKAFNKNLEIL